MRIGDLNSRPTFSTNPELWGDISVLLGSSAGDVFMTGWRAEALAWEQKLSAASWVTEPQPAGPDGLSGSACRPDGQGARPAWTFLEVVAIERIPAATGRLVSGIVGDPGWAALDELAEPSQTSATQNRPQFADADLPCDVFDLSVSSMPNSHGRAGTPLQYGTRWLRVMIGSNYLILIWYPISGTWDPEHTRWPHAGVPSLTLRSLREIASGASPKSCLRSILADIQEHQRYYLESWQLELERWEADLYAGLASGAAPLRNLSFTSSSLVRSGVLADFLTRSQTDLRVMRRRVEAEPVLTSFPDVEGLHAETARSQQLLAESQVARRNAFALFTQLATGEQLQLAQDQAKATRDQQRAAENLHRTIMWISAIVLGPSLIIGIYGANLPQLSPGALGSFSQMVGLLLASIGVSAAVLWAVSPPRTLWPGVSVLSLGLMATVLTLGWSSAGWLAPPWSSTTSGWLLCGIAWTLAGATWVGRRASERPGTK